MLSPSHIKHWKHPCWFEEGHDDQHSTAPSVTSGAVGDGPCSAAGFATATVVAGRSTSAVSKGSDHVSWKQMKQL